MAASLYWDAVFFEAGFVPHLFVVPGIVPPIWGSHIMADENAAKAKIVKIVLTLVVLAVAGVIFYIQFKPHVDPVATIWYWDETAKKLVAAPDDLSPARPLGAAPNAERTLVRAYIYSCSNCSDAATLTPVYLEKFSEEARGIASRYGTMGSDVNVMMPMAQIKRPNDSSWVAWDSEDASAIRETKPCADGTPPKLCEKAGQ